MYNHHECLLLFALTQGLALWCEATPQLVVKTEKGTVVGAERGGVRQFLAVPYAASPAGVNRWKPPGDAMPWDGHLDASKPGVGCAGVAFCDDPKACSEDCLKLDIYTPLDVGDSLLPVMVYLPGGAFITGSTEGEGGLYNASGLVRDHGVVIVSVNYRLGAFGFLTLSDTEVAGNFGLMDQRAGLRWVQRNARAFGGDPTRVTIWGESAGAMSISVLMASNKSQGLFSAAIMESNVPGYSYRTRTQAEAVGHRFAQAVPACAEASKTALLQCLKAQNTSALNHASNSAIGKIVSWRDLQENVLPWTPVVDGDQLPDQVLNVFRAGTQLKVPILIGTNRNEFDFFSSFLKYLPVKLNNAELDAAIVAVFGPISAWRLTSQYPSRDYKNVNARVSRFITDWMFTCSSDRLAKYHSETGTSAFAYRFDQSPNVHGGELEYVFGNFWSAPSEPKKALSSAMQEFWTSFAKHHMPVSKTATVGWPKFNSSEVHVVFNSAANGLNITHDGVWPFCPLWDSIGYYHTSLSSESSDTMLV